MHLALALGVTVAWLVAALASDEPLVMLVGTFPIGWIAVEFCWCASRVSQAREDK